MTKKLKLFITICGLTTNLLAGTLNVPSEYSTIQSAINASVDGDTVVVAEGTYFENIRFYGKGILVGSEYVVDKNTNHILNTIIDGSQPTIPDTASCVLFIDNEDSTSIIEGFTITGGTGTAWLDEHGAGLYYEGGGILSAFSGPIIRHNIIRGNKAKRLGGGSATSAGGGAIRCGDGNPTIIGNIIMNNQGKYGGGIVMNYTKGKIKNNIIYNNEVAEYKNSKNDPPPASFGGGGIWVNQEGPVIIENNTIIFNTSAGSNNLYSGKGGGILFAGAEVVIRNNIVWGNTQQFDKQISRIGGTFETSYNDIEDGFDGIENISVDPLFEGDNYMLSENSPCIDAGDPSLEYNDPAEGNSALWPAHGTERNDIGAYGGPMRFVFPSVLTEVQNKEEVKYSFSLEQNYPNPFNPSTNISFKLPGNGSAKLKVYDILGKQVAEVLLPNAAAGVNTINFDAGNLSSGIYFYQLNFEENYLINKMTVVK